MRARGVSPPVRGEYDSLEAFIAQPQTREVFDVELVFKEHELRHTYGEAREDAPDRYLRRKVRGWF